MYTILFFVEIGGAVLFFVLIFIGLLGKSWKKNEKGKTRLTGKGWLACICAILITGLGIYKICSARIETVKAEEERKKREEVQMKREEEQKKRAEIVFRNLHSALNYRLMPFETFYQRNKKVYNLKDNVVTDIEWQLFYNWESEGFKSIWHYVNVNKEIIVASNIVTWKTLLGLNHDQFIDRLSELRSDYNDIFSTRTLEIMDSLIHKKYVETDSLNLDIDFHTDYWLRENYNDLPYEEMSVHLDLIRRLYTSIKKIPKVSSYKYIE